MPCPHHWETLDQDVTSPADTDPPADRPPLPPDQEPAIAIAFQQCTRCGVVRIFADQRAAVN